MWVSSVLAADDDNDDTSSGGGGGLAEEVHQQQSFPTLYESILNLLIRYTLHKQRRPCSHQMIMTHLLPNR